VPPNRCAIFLFKLLSTIYEGAPITLELQVEAHLDLSLIVRNRLGDGRTPGRDCTLRSPLTRSTGPVVQSSAAAASARPDVRKIKVRMVEDIEELRSETESKSLA